MAAKLGVVTVTYNSRKVIEAFIRCVLAQQGAGFALVIIDNASSDDTLAIIARYQDKRIVVIPNNTNVGVAAANNQGIRTALDSGCDKVLLINNDVEFDAHLFANLLASMRSLDAEMLAPKIYYWDQPKKVWYGGGRFCWPRPYAARHCRSDHTQAGPVEYSPTCCMLVKASVFERIGFMDENYFVYYDDTDFCHRALKASIRLCYDPGISLQHKVSSLAGSEPEFARRYTTRNVVYFIRKNYPVWEALPRLCFLQAYFFARLLSGRDRWAEFRRRQCWFREGLAMPANPPPVPICAKGTDQAISYGPVERTP